MRQISPLRPCCWAGIAYLLAVARPPQSSATVEALCLRGIRWAALALTISEVITGRSLECIVAWRTAVCRFGLWSIPRSLHLVWSAAFLAALLSVSARIKRTLIPLSLLLLIATVSSSHAAARLDHRLLLGFATAAHHLGTAAWIGGHAIPPGFSGTRRNFAGSSCFGQALFFDGLCSAL